MSKASPECDESIMLPTAKYPDDRYSDEFQIAYVSRELSDRSVPSPEIQGLIDGEQRLVVRTGTRFEDGKEQVLPVSIVYHPNSKGIIVQEGGFMHGISPDLPTDTAFRASIAHTTECTVITVGLPGVADKKFRELPEGARNSTTLDQKWGLLFGNMGPVADSMAGAVVETIKQIKAEGQEVILLTPSLTTAIGPAWVKPLLDRGVNVKGLGLIEPVGIKGEDGKHQGAIRLLLNFAKSARHLPKYLAENHELYQKAVDAEKGILKKPQMITGFFRSALYGLAIGSGRTLDTLMQKDTVNTMNNNQTKVVLVSGGQSEFDTFEKTQEAVRRLRTAGFMGARALMFGGATHSISGSSRGFGIVANEIRRAA